MREIEVGKTHQEGEEASSRCILKVLRGLLKVVKTLERALIKRKRRSKRAPRAKRQEASPPISLILPKVRWSRGQPPT